VEPIFCVDQVPHCFFNPICDENSLFRQLFLINFSDDAIGMFAVCFFEEDFDGD
jgi:hypothetical protein